MDTWLHADFKLDIDYPYEIVKKENLYARPPRIPYNNNRIRYRHYGKTLELMIRKATELEAGVEKEPANQTAGYPEEEIFPYLE